MNVENGSRTSRCVGSLLLLLLVVAGCASDKKTIANAQAANDQLAPAIITDAEVNTYINQVGSRIIAAAKADDAEGLGPKSHKKGENAWMFSDQTKFHLVNSKMVNAFTTGGQHLYVYSALVALCDDEDDLAAVMSHEFAHIYCRHVQAGTDRQTGMKVFGYAAEGAGYLYGGTANGANYSASAAKGATSITQYVGLRYTRGDETEADLWGFKFYGRAGWDPADFGHFFQTMINHGYDTTPASKSDHPTLASRVVAAKADLADWNRQGPDKVAAMRKPLIKTHDEFQAFKARVAQIAASSPDDSQTQKAQQLLASFNSCLAPVNPPEGDAGLK
jgi:predicted Zn-dependent protease